MKLAFPIGILDEHPAWSNRLIVELTERGVPVEKIDVSAHGFRPDDGAHRYSVIEIGRASCRERV